MASYQIRNIRPSVILNDEGNPVNGFTVRIFISPWEEVRDLELVDDKPETIHNAAVDSVKNRAALDGLNNTDIEV